MDTANLQKNYERALNDIENRALKPAFDKIRQMIGDNENWELLEKTDSVEQNYRYLLSYLVEGVEDKERGRVYNSIIVSMFQLADDVFRHARVRNQSNIYCEKLRALQLSSLPEISEVIQRLLLDANEIESEQNAAQLFNACWLSDRLPSDTRNSLSAFLLHNDIKLYHKQLVLSALMLGCFAHFDETKIVLLIDICLESGSLEIRQQTLVAVLLLVGRYENRLSYYETLTRELKGLCAQPWFVPNARSIAMRFTLSRQTEKINRDINLKFRKHMSDIKPYLESQIKGSKLPSEFDDIFDDKNPEWEKSLSNKEVEKLMDDVMRMQTEGADLMAETFGRLKYFPFFNTISNWFLPYYSQQSAIIELKNTDESILKMSPLMCDSDKYSLMFASNQIEPGFFEMVRQQIDANSEAVEEQQKEFSFTLDPEKRASALATLYIHNLYRFFKNHPRHLDFYDPFRFPLEIYRIKQLKEYTGDIESLALFSDYYIGKDLYSEAIPLLTDLTGKAPSQAEYFQKLGYCYQMCEQFDAAINAYEKADLIQSDHLWTIKKLAACYRQTGQTEKALAFYRRADALQPDNTPTLLSIGHLLMEQSHIDEALTYYFKVEFTDKRGEKAWRPIAWASFLVGKREQSKRYYDQILSANPTPTDRLNAGHLQTASGNIREAIGHYTACIKEGSLNDFLKQYAADRPVLSRLKVDDVLLDAIRDQIIYTVKG